SARAAVARTKVVRRAERAERATDAVRGHPLADQIAHERDVGRMRADGLRADAIEPVLARHRRRRAIEVEPDLEMIGDEADRHDDDVLDAFMRELDERLGNVRAEPRLAAVTRVVALVDEPPALVLERVADEPARLAKLRL